VESSPAATARAEDLVIEKKRLQLVGLDPEKFDYFFDKYYDQIFNFAFWRTGDHDQAADVASETFGVAWDRRGQFRWQGYSFGAWLFQIARSVLSHNKRRRETRRETEYIAEYHDPADETTPADTLAAKTDQAIVRQCLGQLSEAQHEVIVLNFFMGLTTREIAVITEWPLGTVNSHLRRGKRALRRSLAAHGNSGDLSEAAVRIIRQAERDDTELSIIEGTKDE
jgi:RNA polymerase sigma-70 factor (ECF subfamily)